jgi:hypothetical protein
LQKKIAERTAALRVRAADSAGPLFDHNSKSWTIETADCPLVKSQVKGTGFKAHTVFLGVNDDGSYHIQLRTEASGTAVDAGGGKYIWNYSSVAELDTADPTVDSPVVTGYAPGLFQLIPVGTGGAGLTVATYLQSDTPTPLNSPALGAAEVATAPAACEPL